MNAVTTVQQVASQLRSLSPSERQQVVAEALRQSTPDERKTVERLLRRLQHPDVPDDVWDGFEECEDGKAIEMKDEHCTHPPAGRVNPSVAQLALDGLDHLARFRHE